MLKAGAAMLAAATAMGTSGSVAGQNQTNGGDTGNITATGGGDMGEFEIPGETAVFQGSGQHVTKALTVNKGALLAEAQFADDVTLSITAVPQGDRGIETPMMTAETSPGVGGAMVSDGPYVFGIEPTVGFTDTAAAEWNLTLIQPRVNDEPPVASPPVTYEGNSSAIVGPVQFSGGGRETITFEHEGEGWVDVYIYPQNGDYSEFPFTNSGTFEGETTVQTEGVSWITVQASGQWTLALESITR